MAPLTCPHCRVSADVLLEAGVRRRACGACHREFWVTVAEPVLSKEPPGGT